MLTLDTYTNMSSDTVWNITTPSVHAAEPRALPHAFRISSDIENKWRCTPRCTPIFEITSYMNSYSIFVKTMHFHWVCELSALHIHAQLDVRITFFQGDVHTPK